MSMQLLLVVPGLFVQPPQVLATAPSLALLARLAGEPRLQSRGIAAALIAALGASPDTPVAPLAALGAGFDPNDDYVAAADPVFFAADRDDLVLMQRIDDLAADEATTLVALLNGHFETDGLRFTAVRPDTWFVRCANAPDIVTVPFDAAHRRGLYPFLPRGADGGIWRRWQNEIGMLLHEHPINTAREARGDVAVNGIWFWGGGQLTDAWPLPRMGVVAGAGRHSDLMRGIARKAGGTVHAREAGDTAIRVVDRASAAHTADSPQPEFVTVVIEPAGERNWLSTLESQWLSPGLALLSRHAIDTLHLLADGNGTAAQWTLQRPPIWRRLATTMRRKPFDVPTPLEP